MSSIIKHTPICIIGGGSASLNFTSQILKEKNVTPSQIRIFEPSKFHFYQPQQLLVGGGVWPLKKSKNFRPLEQVFHKKVNITQEAIKLIDPKKRIITTTSNNKFQYDQLLILSGLQTNFKAVKGAKEALDDPNFPAVSMDTMKYAKKIQQIAKKIRSGRALFTQPQSPIKCQGGPQKLVFLLEALWKKLNVRKNIDISYFFQQDKVFPQQKYANALLKFHKERGINIRMEQNLVEVDKGKQLAIFEDSVTKEKLYEYFDFIHFLQRQLPAKFIKDSGLANKEGFVKVNPFTFQHLDYDNIWSFADCAGLPITKTMGALTAQTPIAVKNFISHWRDKLDEFPVLYDGYTACPIAVGNKKLMLTEFKYNGVLAETFFNNQEVPRKLFFYFDKYMFEKIYWNLMTRGLWSGHSGINLKNLWKSFA